MRLTGYNRNYASWLLRHAGKKVYKKHKGGRRVIVVADPSIKIRRRRKKLYDMEVYLVLRRL